MSTAVSYELLREVPETPAEAPGLRERRRVIAEWALERDPDLRKRVVGEVVAEEDMHIFVRQFERRLGRPLLANEQHTLRARLTTLGSERLSDVVVDRSGDALAAWLAAPDAT